MGTYINQLNSVSTLTGGDNFAVGSSANGDDRRAALSTLATYLQSALTIVDASAMSEYTTQYAAPSATGQTIQVTDTDDNTHLIITPVTSYAAMTITLPTSTNLVDKQDILVNCTQAITTLTINGNGATVVGEPSTLKANSYFRLKYDLAGTTWYNVSSGDDIAAYATAVANTLALRDANADLFARVFQSTVATGTAPLVVASTTAVANLNADQTDGYDADETDTGSTLAARDATGDIQANAFESTVATGTAPLTVASTTAVSNLNADQTDGYDAAEADTGSTLAARDASGDITANAFESTVATGTAPLTIASTTLVSNLNSDTVDGFDAQIAPGASTISVRDTDDYLQATNFVSSQGAPAAQTTSATLTAAQLATMIITVNEGAGANSAQTLPLATAMDTEFDTFGIDQSFDFSVINISTVAAETVSIVTNTGWTLVGNMLIAANTAITDNSQGRFRARRTGAGAWTLYRIA